MNKIITIDHRILVRDHIELLKLPVIIYVNEFTEKSAKSFSENMSKAHNVCQPIIPIVIDSYGGHVYSLLSMLADIDNSDIPVATICKGKAMSCGAWLLTCGAEDNRYIDSSSRVMIHDVSSTTWGKNEEIKVSAAETNCLNNSLYRRMAKNCGHPKNYFLDLIKQKGHADWFLSAKQAKKHNIVNHIKIPTLYVDVNVEIGFE